jgi:hypothetical protein
MSQPDNNREELIEFILKNNSNHTRNELEELPVESLHLLKMLIEMNLSNLSKY